MRELSPLTTTSNTPSSDQGEAELLTLSGFICPACGGPLWEQQYQGGPIFQCRIGDVYSAATLWKAQCEARMSALKTAERSLAEHAELARKLASWNSERGDQFLMERLEAQAEA